MFATDVILIDLRGLVSYADYFVIASAQTERQTRRVWHLANLPAGSDVAHLRRQIAALDHELRQVRRALEQTERRLEGERDGPARSRAAGRRSQRAPRP